MKEKALSEIAAEIARCRTCKKDKIGLPVPGEGSADAKIVFLGEAPGKKEAQTGKPFIGPAGKVLHRLLAQAGIRGSEVFITSPVKYLPKHVTPTLEEIRHGRKHLDKQLAVIKPKLIVLMGRVACQAILERDYSPALDHGKIIKSDGVSYFLTYHPAASLHNPNLRTVIAADFKKLKKLIANL